VKLGVMMFTADYTVAPPRLAQLVEQRGFESLFFPDLSHRRIGRVRQ